MLTWLKSGVTSPSLGADEMSTLRSSSERRSSDLISDAVHVVNSLTSGDRATYADAVKAVAELWAFLQRTNPYVSAIRSLRNRTAQADVEWQTLQQLVQQAVRFWRERMSTIISRIQHTAIWDSIWGGHLDERIGILPMERTISRLARLQHVPDTDESRRALAGIVSELTERGIEVARHVYSFFVNPARSAPKDWGDKVRTTEGRQLPLLVELDEGVGLVLCDLSELNMICGELSTNWQKARPGSAIDVRVWVRLYREDEFAVLEFGDSLVGRFDSGSWGGLRTTTEFCEKFGGRIRFWYSDDGNEKAVRLGLRLLSQAAGVRSDLQILGDDDVG